MRIATWAGALMLAAAALTSCGGDGGGGGANSGDTSGVNVSCNAIDDIQSYRYTITLQLNAPAFQEPEESTPADPLGAFADALAALFADMRLEGSHVAPDRSQVVLRFETEELELRAIEDKSWVRVGATWQEQESPLEPGTLLTPQAVCEDTVKDLAPSLSGLESQSETVNGIESDHYHLDEADLKQLPQLLATSPDSELPQSFNVDLWLARDGRWPVRLQIAATDTDEEGEPVDLELFMEFRDINDPAIKIEPPLLSPLGT